MAVPSDADGIARGEHLVGRLPDEAVVYGLLAKLRDLGLTLIAVRRLPDSDYSPSDTSS